MQLRVAPQDAFATHDVTTRLLGWLREHAALWAALSSGLIAVVVYWSTLASDLTWAHYGADGGDLAAALLTGGVPHPPGAPLYLWLGEFFLRLPFSNPARALHALSALSAAGASGLIAHSAALQAPPQLRLPTAWIAGLGLAFSPLLWSQAVITELYAPAALMTALILSLAIRRQHSRGMLIFLGLAQGAGAAIHPSLLLLVPLSTYPLWREGARRRWLLSFLAGLFLGLLPYATIPLRAASGASVNWGHATDLQGWWWLVSGKLYQGYLFGFPLTHLPARLSVWSGLILTQFSLPSALLCTLGIVQIWRRSRSLVYAMGASTLGLSVLAIGYATVDSHLWLIPAMVLLAYALGRGFLFLTECIPDRWRLPLAISLAGCIVLWQLMSHWQAVDAGQDMQARDFIDCILQEAPSDALLITGQDRHTFSLWYAIYGLGQRPDLEIIDQDLWDYAWYQMDMRVKLGAEFDLDDLSGSLTRPICTVGVRGELRCE